MGEDKARFPLSVRRRTMRLEVPGLEEGPDLVLRGRSVAPPPACRCCGASLDAIFADLGPIPLRLEGIPARRADAPESFRRLRTLSCSDCGLVQQAPGLPLAQAELVEPSPSPRGQRLAERHAEAMIAWLGLDASTQVAEVESGAGHRLHPFARRGIPVLGLSTAAGAARMARQRGIATVTAGFGAALATRLRAAGHAPVLLSARGVLDRVPDLHGLLAGFRTLLAPGGVLVLEVPSLLRIVLEGRLDALRHQRLSYLCLATMEIALLQHGLAVFDAEEPTGDGGTLRLFVRHAEDRGKPVTEAVEALRAAEGEAGLGHAAARITFAARAAEVTCALLDFLLGARRAGQRVAGHVAPGAGDTLVNHCGVGPELLPFVVDSARHRHGLLMAGRRIPIRPPGAILEERPDFVLILAAEAREEIVAELGAIREWGGRFVLPGPAVQLF